MAVSLTAMEILNASPLPEVGETLHINHHNCPAGMDIKQRLYLTRKKEQPWVVLAYCHNCASGGAAVLNSGTSYLHNPVNDLKLPSGNYTVDVEEPILDRLVTARDREFCSLDLAPAYVKEYLAKYIELSDAEMGGIKWHENSCSLIYPKPLVRLCNPTQSLFFLEHQSRSFIKGAPKYITHSLRNNLNRHEADKFTSVMWEKGENEAVIVEDYLSAVKLVCNPRLTMSAVPLYGNHLAIDHLLRLSHQYTKIIVWLDNDNQQIRDSAQKIAAICKAIGIYDVGIVTNTNEPKYHSYEAMEQILKTGVESV